MNKVKKSASKLKPLLFASAIALPLQDLDNWQLLEYSNLPSNHVEFGEQGMRIIWSV